MTRFIAFIAVLVALVSVLTPSVAVGSRGFVAHAAPLYQLQTDGTYLKAPCPLTGGKRLLHCRPDLGVLPQIGFLEPAPPKPVPLPALDLMHHRLVIAPTVPPPRTA
jgi:hypothetical protein